MPIHEYECKSCVTRFEQFFKTRDEVTDTYQCVFCGKASSKVISAANFAFGAPVVTQDGNSGVYSVDSNIDQVVGRDAKRRKKIVEKRQAEKTKLRQENGGAVLTRKTDGSYKPLEASKVEHRNNKVASVNQAYREARSGDGAWKIGSGPSPSP